ncbi:MAG: sulfatase-like hydrolase/transferase [Saprospiraceae bacterium]|nr:sulfatase-like hydrolase/transferase [Saprospiraceae bacterium]
MKLVSKILLLLSCLGIGCFSCSNLTNKEAEAHQTPPTNIILLMGDDHGWEETGYGGHPFIKTPVLDQMAGGGLILDKFYSAHPSCSPTRGSIITGRHPNRYGTFAPGWSIRPEEVSIAHLLKEAGYTTAHFGKWHLGPVKAGSPTNPGAMGFDTWVSHDNFFEMNPTLSHNGAAPEKIVGEGSEVIIDKAISFINQNTSSSSPFFIVVWFGSPHEPYQALPTDLALYENLPDSLANQYVRLTSLTSGERVERPLDSVLQERFAEITAMDRAIGKLRNHLKTKDLQDNTMVWYCGDNGIPSSGLYHSSLHGLKGTVYEGGTRVPGIIEWPKIVQAPIRSAMNAVTTDIFPTLCELVGLELPNRPMDGVSLLPLIKGEQVERAQPIHFWNFDTRHLAKDTAYIDVEKQKGTTPLVKKLRGAYTRNFQNFRHTSISPEDFLGERAILDDNYKLIIDEQKGQEVKELYDIREDPGEKKNLIAQNPTIAIRLEKQMKDWQQSVLESLLERDYEKSNK